MRDFDSIKQKEMGIIEDRVRHIYNRGYEDGLKDGKESCQIDETEAYLMGTENAAKQFQPELKRAYNDGLNDAWEYARKIATDPYYGGLTSEELKEIFGSGFTSEIMKDNTASEAIAKIKEWEEKQEKQDGWKRIGIDVYECPACGIYMRTSDICAHKYCHGCGAKIRDGEE